VRILLLGPQGSGKGTQAKRIAAEYGLPHIATGDILRAAISEQTELGRRVAPILAQGQLVPDELTIELIRERLAGADAFILDGLGAEVERCASCAASTRTGWSSASPATPKAKL